ncbi:MAG: hypothetical protein ABJI62_12740, partial [Alphaproteobacteria bacterium]
MIDADDFLTPLRARGFDFFTGVPCSFLTPLINKVVGGATGGGNVRLDYVPAASEGEAVAIASGAWLAGRGTVVMFQNSGLGNAVNPLTSLNHPFRIPSLVVTTWRGAPGLKDEPQHEVMGEITPDLLDVIRIPHLPFPTEAGSVEPALKVAQSYMDAENLPFAFIMEKGSVADDGLEATPLPAPDMGPVADLFTGGDLPGRMRSMEAVLSVLPDDAGIIATTGKCGRELFTIEDRKQHLYQVGSMGGAAGMGLGAALNVTSPIVVFDGDGAALGGAGDRRLDDGDAAQAGAEGREISGFATHAAPRLGDHVAEGVGVALRVTARHRGGPAVGGVDALGALQAAAICVGLPFTVILLAMCLSLYLGLRHELAGERAA